METYQSRKKVRVVGILDAIVTVALISQVIYCTLYPVWSTYSYHATRHLNSTTVTVTQPPIAPGSIMTIHGEPPTRSTFGGFTVMKAPNPRVDKIGDAWLLSIFGVLVLYGLLSIVATAALVRSANENTDSEKALGMTRFWMSWNILTFFLAAIEFMVVLILPVLGIHVGVPIPTLLYIGLRAIFTCIVFQELNTMGPTLIATLDANYLEEKRARMEMNYKLPLYERPIQTEVRVGLDNPILTISPSTGGEGMSTGKQVVTPEA